MTIQPISDWEIQHIGFLRVMASNGCLAVGYVIGKFLLVLWDDRR